MISTTRPGWLVPVLIVSRLNEHSVEDTLRFYASEFGAGTAMVNRFNIGGLGLQHASELSLSKDELRDVFSRIDKVAGELGMTVQSGVCTPICILDPNEYPNIRFSHCTTDLSSRPLTVSYKGEVRFCNHSPRVLGNIYEKPIGDIVAESQADGYFHSVPEHCKECALWSRCRGGCRAASEQLYGTFGRVDPVLERC
jgi:radical SAM protein with 4Fe4S-binding SPASM domain